MANGIGSRAGRGSKPIVGAGSDDIILGSVLADHINAGDGNDWVWAGEGDDFVKGGDGDDTVAGGLGNDILFGNDGTDTALYSGSIFDFSWVAGPGGSLSVTDLNAGDGNEGTDTLKHFEFLKFSDYTLNLHGNNAPSLVGGDITVIEDQVTSFDVNAFDFDGDPLTLVSYSANLVPGTPGSTALSPVTGTGVSYHFSFDATAYDWLAVGDTTTEAASVTVSDGMGGVTTLTFDITVVGVNDAPVADDALVTVSEDDGPVTIDLNALVGDVDAGAIVSVTAVSASGDAVTYAVVDGVVSFDSGQFNALSQGGSAGFQLSYTAEDEHGATDTGVVTVEVTGVNDAPTASGPTAPVAVTEDGNSVSIDLSPFGSDPDTGDTLVFTAIRLINTADGRAVPVPLTMSGNSVSFNPTLLGLDEGEIGNYELVFEVSDGVIADQGVVPIQITGSADEPVPNSAPVAGNDVVSDDDVDSIVIDLNLLVSDPDGDPVTITGVSISSGGRAVSLPYTLVAGVLTIDPTALGLATGQTAAFNIDYAASDGSGALNSTATGTVLLDVTGSGAGTPPNGQPVATDATVTETNDAMITIDLLALSSDPDGDPLTITVDAILVDGVAITPGDLSELLSAGVLNFDPAALGLADGDSAEITIQYSADDGTGTANSSDSGVVIVTVNDPPSPPSGSTHLLDFEPFWDSADNTAAIGVYDGFEFTGDMLVIETDEVAGGGGRGGGLPTGFTNGLVSGDNILVAGSSGGFELTTEMSEGDEPGSFDLDTFHLTAATSDGLEVTITAYDWELTPGVGYEYVEAGSIVVTVDAGSSSLVDLSTYLDAGGAQIFDGVEKVVFSTVDPANLMVIDDMALTLL